MFNFCLPARARERASARELLNLSAAAAAVAHRWCAFFPSRSCFRLEGGIKLSGVRAVSVSEFAK